MKHHFEEASHSLPFIHIEPQLLTAYNECPPSELLISTAKHYPLLSKDQLKSELSVHICHVNIYLCALAFRESQLKNNLIELHRLEEMS
jgi:hypothetical protein